MPRTTNIVRWLRRNLFSAIAAAVCLPVLGVAVVSRLTVDSGKRADGVATATTTRPRPSRPPKQPAAPRTTAAPTTTSAPDNRPLRIESPESGQSIDGNVVSLRVGTTGIELVGDGRPSPASRRIGIVVDRAPPRPGQPVEGKGTETFAGQTVRLPGQTVGRHRYTVVIIDLENKRVGDLADQVELTVVGPSVVVSAPERVPAGAAVVLDIDLTGAAVGAPGPRTPRDAVHFDVVADGTPVEAGEVVPQSGWIHTAKRSVALSLRPGRHVIWVVLSGPDERSVSPPAADRVVVVVERPD